MVVFHLHFFSFQHLNEETKIRIKNKQNKLFIFLIYINTSIKIFIKKFYLKKQRSNCKVCPLVLFENPLSTDHNLKP